MRATFKTRYNPTLQNFQNLGRGVKKKIQPVGLSSSGAGNDLLSLCEELAECPQSLRSLFSLNMEKRQQRCVQAALTATERDVL